MELLIILIFVVTNIGTLLLFMRMAKTLNRMHYQMGLDDIGRANNEAMLAIKLDKILDRISQVKTRLADEERDDQREKAEARREVH